MRISDWSSDVCSSDLELVDAVRRHEAAGRLVGLAAPVEVTVFERDPEPRPDRVQHPDALGHHLLADAVPRNRRDPIPCHAPVLPWTRLRRSLCERRPVWKRERRSEEHTPDLQSLMRISYAVFSLQQ